MDDHELTPGELADRSGVACLSLKRCAVSNPGDILAEQGPGSPLTISNKCAIECGM